MGYRFSLEHGNIVVYLSTIAAEAPRIKRELLVSFLYATQDGLDRPWRQGGRLLTQDPSWAELIRFEARRALDTLRDDRRTERVLSAGETAAILLPLRALMSQFRLYALPVWNHDRGPDWLHIPAEAFALRANRALVLFPEEGFSDDRWNTMDTLPAFDMALTSRQHWPGILFWTERGTAAVVPHYRMEDAFERAVDALERTDSSSIERVVRDFADGSGPRKRQILHLSDLHFGTKTAAVNAPMLEAELHDAAKKVDRVVVTGDLFDNPTERDLVDYQRFSQAIHRNTGKEPLCVPGNHDMRWLGNIGSTSEQVAALSWSSHVVDDQMSTIFLGLNSASKGHFARGKVGQQQLARLGAEHRNALAVRPELKNYLTIALVHHHPYSFSTTPTTLIQRVLAAVGLGDERFMRMVDAKEFTEWCARWGVSVVLHGHKHVPRYEMREITPEGSRPFELPAVGCGSSLGAEGTPLTYAVLSWNEHERRWSATFYESRAGGPFEPRLITVTRDAQTVTG